MVKYKNVMVMKRIIQKTIPDPKPTPPPPPPPPDQ